MPQEIRPGDVMTNKTLPQGVDGAIATSTTLSTGSAWYQTDPGTRVDVSGSINAYTPALTSAVNNLALVILLVGFWNVAIQWMRWIEDRKR